MKDDHRLLGLSTDAVPDFLYTVTAARRSWAEQNKQAVVRYVRGLAAAFRFIRQPANRPAVVKTIIEWTDSSADIAEQTLKLYFAPERNVLPMRGEINLKGLAQVIAFMAEAGTIPAPLPAPERFVDLQYLQAAGIQ